MRRLNAIARVLAGLLAIGATPALAQHAGHQQEPPKAQAPPKPSHWGCDRPLAASKASRELPPFIPPITDEDRKAAFPRTSRGMRFTTASNHYFVLFDQLEWQSNAGATGLNIDTKGWVGRDRDRLWFRAEGDGEDGRVGEAEAHVLYGRQFSRWWDVVAGVRQDFRAGAIADLGSVWRSRPCAVLVRGRAHRLRRRLGPYTPQRRGRVRAAPHEPARPATSRRGRTVRKIGSRARYRRRASARRMWDSGCDTSSSESSRRTSA